MSDMRRRGVEELEGKLVKRRKVDESEMGKRGWVTVELVGTGNELNGAEESGNLSFPEFGIWQPRKSIKNLPSL
jgi:hypothetical protein